MPRIETSIATRDGTCPASVFIPTTSHREARPAVIFFMDGCGVRPTLWEMGQRLADSGYLVLLPDLYYRLGAYAPMEPAEVLGDPLKREALMKMVNSLNRDRKISDATAFLQYLSTRSDVKKEHYGLTGYCMGGNMALTVAGAFPARFRVIATFHGGNLAANQGDSPHHFLKGIAGSVYVASAVEDPSFPEDQKIRLEDALSKAGVNHLMETYPGAHHGFAIPDVPAFNADAAARHWKTLLELLQRML